VSKSDLKKTNKSHYNPEGKQKKTTKQKKFLWFPKSLFFERFQNSPFTNPVKNKVDKHPVFSPFASQLKVSSHPALNSVFFSFQDILFFLSVSSNDRQTK
jgi:hypothetical protein